MPAEVPYRVLADAVLLLHFGIVAFVVGGLALVLAGNLFAWQWVNGFWFRLAHLGAIAVVVAESWFGYECPLTTFEAWLRVQAGDPAYERSFIEYWVQRVLFYQAPGWVFAVAYTAFALLVVAAWWHFPPVLKKPRTTSGA